MTDKERIEKFMLTLKHLDNCMTLLRKANHDPEVEKGIDKIKETINYAINKNLDIIDIEK